ncbi:hypothetical protein Vadar_015004 [Vaccinium darrowii]|uniref:Uncharacterized protein n=1 Tax=Vaccinium darrowii TaxID=229202 RepID=A0ACB7Y7E4_9ERIC|nr:hypothetical protein Vadar_015004 [Vaccinium darrowii]
MIATLSRKCDLIASNQASPEKEHEESSLGPPKSPFSTSNSMQTRYTKLHGKSVLLKGNTQPRVEQVSSKQLGKFLHQTKQGFMAQLCSMVVEEDSDIEPPSQPRKLADSSSSFTPFNAGLKPIVVCGNPPTFVSAPGRRRSEVRKRWKK